MKRLLLIAFAGPALATARAGVLVPDTDQLPETADGFLDFRALKATSEVARALAGKSLPPTREARIAEARLAAAQRPTDPMILARLGQTLLAANRLDEAASWYWRAARLRPADTRRVEEFGFALLASGDHTNGLRVYEALFAKEPKTPRVQFNLAAAYYHLGRHAEAAALMREFTTQQPTHLRGWYNQGVMQLRAGQPGLAGQSLQRALQLQPGHPFVLAALARLNRAQGRREVFEQTRTLLTERIGAAQTDALLAHEPMPIYLIR